MAQGNRRHEIALKKVVYQIPGAEALTIEKDITYAVAEGQDLKLDLYRPAAASRDVRSAAVVFVIGYRDAGMRTTVGCDAKEMASYVSWAQLVAAWGLIGVTYTNQDPASNVHDVIGFLRDHAETLGIDRDRIGLWACSGNAPTALSVLMDPLAGVKCAAFCYGYLLDSDGGTAVEEASRACRFANPCVGRSIADIPTTVPILIARAGRDEMPGLNVTTDRFLANALARNLPITLVNHPTGPHAFDIADDSETSRAAIRQILAFLRIHIAGPESN